MDHQKVPGTGGEQSMKGDQRFGAEAQKVAWAGMTYRRSADDCLGDNRWLGQKCAGVKLAQSVSGSGS